VARVVVLLLVAALVRIDSTDALLTAATASPANRIVTGVGTWFAGTGTGTAICAGTSVALACPFGAQPAVGVTTATISLRDKAVATTYTLTVVNGTGPAPITTIIRVTFLSTGTRTAVRAAGVLDTIRVVLRIRGATPVGTYTGSLQIADALTGLSVLIPLSVTH
jgi:hypothetical protein